MRLSTYEIILPLVGTDEKPIEGYALLVNGLYGAIDIVPKEDADKLQAGNLAGLPAALRERLMLRGHITRKDEAGELCPWPDPPRGSRRRNGRRLWKQPARRKCLIL